jgi:hypothetical protein
LRSTRYVAFGQVVGVHIDDRFIKDGRLDTAAMQWIARCGYADDSVVDKVFAMARPKVLFPKQDAALADHRPVQ